MNIWTRLGIAVAIIALFYIGTTECLRQTVYFETYKWQTCSALLGLGLVIWLIGNFSKPKNERPAQIQRSSSSIVIHGEADSIGAPRRLFSMRYCGSLLMILGVIVSVIMPIHKPAITATPSGGSATNHLLELVQVRQKPRASQVNFPQLKLQGVICRRPNPCALINGKTFFVGEDVGGAKLVSVSQDHVTIERGGTEKVLFLRY